MAATGVLDAAFDAWESRVNQFTPDEGGSFIHHKLWMRHKLGE